MSKKTLIILIVVICLVVGAGVGAYFYLSQVKYKGISHEEITPSQEEAQQQEEPSQEQAIAEAEEEIPLPEYTWEGEYPFRISGTEGIYPKFKSGKFSKRPMDVIGGVDSELEAFIKVEDPEGVSKVTLLAIGHKDNIREEIDLKLSEGDSFSGTWSAKFEIPESMKRIFWTNFYAQNKKAKKEVLDLDWRPGATCPVVTSGNLTFGACNCAGGEVVGSDNGQITVTGTVNLTGASLNPAYMIYGTKVILSGVGKIVFSAHVSGKATAILIKKGRIDSVKSKAAAICAFYDNIKCNPDGGYYDDGADSPSGTNYCKHNYYRCSLASGSCVTNVVTDATCGPCKYCNVSSCSTYSNTSWDSPTGYIDAATWHNEPRIYDNDLTDNVSFGYCDKNSIAANSWGAFLELTRSSIPAHSIRIYGNGFDGGAGRYSIDIDVYRDGGWVNVFSGGIPQATWTTKTFTAGLVTKARIRLYKNGDFSWTAEVYEFDFGRCY